jgi:hypothetical protein
VPITTCAAMAGMALAHRPDRHHIHGGECQRRHLGRRGAPARESNEANNCLASGTRVQIGGR